MNLFEATMLAEGSHELVEGEVTEERVIEAWQWLYDTEAYIFLQGFYGRTIRDMIASGLIHV